MTKNMYMICLCAILLISSVDGAYLHCAGPCFNKNINEVVDMGEMTTQTNAYSNSSGLDITDTVGIVDAAGGDAYCKAVLGSTYFLQQNTIEWLFYTRNQSTPATFLMFNKSPAEELVYNFNSGAGFSLSSGSAWAPYSASFKAIQCRDYSEWNDGGYEVNAHWLMVTPYYVANQFSSPLVVNFTGSPLDGYSPLSVLFTIQNYSAVNVTGSKWYFGDGQISNVTAATINHTYTNPGIYTVKLQYVNGTGDQITIEKSNYVLASIPTGMIVNLDVKNAITGALIQDSTVSIRNTTTGVWRNTTAPTGLVYFSTTDPGYLYALSQNQTITLAANKSGYRSAYETFAIPYTNYRARLFLMPDTVVNATGTGTVVVNVVRNKDGLTVSGMSVVLDTGQIGITNGAGAATFLNVTAGARVVRVSDPDGSYQGAETSFDLAEGETRLLVVQVVLEGEMPVTTYGTPVPTPSGTYDPSDPSSAGYGNYTATQVNQQGSEGIVQMLSQLILLWPLIVLGIFIKFMKSAFT